MPGFSNCAHIQQRVQPFVFEWLLTAGEDGRPRYESPFSLDEVLVSPVGRHIPGGWTRRQNEMMLASILKALGYKRVDGWLRGRKAKYWIDRLI